VQNAKPVQCPVLQCPRFLAPLFYCPLLRCPVFSNFSAPAYRYTVNISTIRRDCHRPIDLYRASERIQFKLATLVYRSLHGLAPRYLSDDLRRVADIPSRRNLRSASSCQLEVTRTRLTSVGDRTFSAAGSRLWNSLPRDITECQTVEAFKRQHCLFSLSFPGF